MEKHEGIYLFEHWASIWLLCPFSQSCHLSRVLYTLSGLLHQESPRARCRLAVLFAEKGWKQLYNKKVRTLWISFVSKSVWSDISLTDMLSRWLKASRIAVWYVVTVNSCTLGVLIVFSSAMDMWYSHVSLRWSLCFSLKDETLKPWNQGGKLTHNISRSFWRIFRVPLESWKSSAPCYTWPWAKLTCQVLLHRDLI